MKLTDHSSNKAISQSIAPAAQTTGTVNGTGIDTANYGAVTVAFLAGTRTDGTHTPTVEESDSSGSGYTTVAAADLVGSLVAITSNSVQKVAYIGKKRYVRAVSTVSGTTTGAVYGAWVILEGAHKQT